MTNQTYTFTLTTDELAVIGQALEQIPYKYAAPIIASINKQLHSQSVETPTPVDN